MKEPRGLSHPVVLIWGQDAERLMGVVNNNREAHVKIEVKEAPEWVSALPSPFPLLARHGKPESSHK